MNKIYIFQLSRFCRYIARNMTIFIIQRNDNIFDKKNENEISNIPDIYKNVRKSKTKYIITENTFNCVTFVD